jgi:glucose/mannose transport system substrate-binding protein
MRWVRGWRITALGVVLFASGNARLHAAPRPVPETLTFYHSWTSSSESAALTALVKLFSSRHPDVTVSALETSRALDVRSQFYALKSHQAQGRPPDAFWMHAGSAAQVFYDAGLLSPIDDIWAEDGLESVMPLAVQNLCKLDGRYYAVPVNVHRTNVVWYNKPLLDKHQIDAATLTSWEAFFEAAERLRSAGVRSPIQMGVTWTAKTVFEGIVASQGIKAYQDWVNGKITAADDPRLVKAFQIMKTYLSYTNPDHATIGWDKGIQRVMSGESAFCIMGDWANGEFRLAGSRYGKDYGTFAVPGTKGVFGLGVDTFLHPRGLSDETNSRRWLRLAASREGQDVFNPLKGSISPRSDADTSRYDPYQRTAIADLKSARSLYPTLGSAVPEAFNAHLLKDLEAFAADRDVEKAAAAVAATARQMAGRYPRSWQLN